VTSTRHAPSLRVSAGGRVTATSSGGFEWFVHHGPAPVVFLATSLMALGEDEILDVRIWIEAGATATVTGQGPTTLLKTGAAVVQRWRIEVGAGAHVTFLPWVTIPFPGSRSDSQIHALIDDGGTLCAWDTLAMGRIGRGEELLFEELRSEWRIDGPSAAQLRDRLLVRGDHGPHARTALAGRSHLGSLYVAGLTEPALPLTPVRAILEERAEVAGASRPDPQLLVARALDRSAERLELAFWPVVEQARQAAAAPGLTPIAVARRYFT
jgi:urease accessory protein